eukprot:gene18726-6135_t
MELEAFLETAESNHSEIAATLHVDLNEEGVHKKTIVCIYQKTI